jgi:hypothetical protein
MDDTLYIITPIFNSWRYKSRYKLYKDFETYIKKHDNVRLITIEAAFGDRPWEVTSPDDKDDIQLRTSTELWHKERMINLAVNRLPQGWKYAGYLDSDLVFSRPDWNTEIVQRLQHYSFVQPFSQSINLSPSYEVIGTTRESFFSAYLNNTLDSQLEYGKLPHPGFGLFWTKEAFNAVGGLLDTPILGSSDLHMLASLIGLGETKLPQGISNGYKEQLLMWQNRCENLIRRNIGIVPGLILHQWHGARKDRRYGERWKILVDNQYDPEFDIKLDWQGLYQWSGNKPQLQYDVRNYFASRHEDSIDL